MAPFSSRMISHSDIAIAVATRLAGQAIFSAELIRPQDCDDGFLSSLGKDTDFDPAVMDVKDGSD
jgi:hypothetical protein